jgi:serine/threonine protein kinase
VSCLTAPITVCFGTDLCIENLNKDKLLDRYDAQISDVWSLGVVLANLVTGRAPWRRADRNDACFSAFMRDPMFLRKVMPISMELCALLVRAWDPNPSTRITIPEMRIVIEGIEEFTMPEQELRRCGPAMMRHDDPMLDGPAIGCYASDFDESYSDDEERLKRVERPRTQPRPPTPALLQGRNAPVFADTEDSDASTESDDAQLVTPPDALAARSADIQLADVPEINLGDAIVLEDIGDRPVPEVSKHNPGPEPKAKPNSESKRSSPRIWWTRVTRRMRSARNQQRAS